jgi:hypothetical protein
MANVGKICGKSLITISKIMGVDIGSLSKFSGLSLVSYYTGIDGADDGCYRYIGGYQYYSPGDAYSRHGMTGTSAYAHSWTRFVNVQVPKDATITSAFVRFTFNYTDGDTYMRLRAVASDDAPRIEDIVDWIAISWTSANVLWNLATGGLSGGDVVDTPDISSVVQETVNRAGWAAGNAMAIGCLLQQYNLGDEVRFNSYNQTTYAGPKLYIEYS